MNSTEVETLDGWSSAHYCEFKLQFETLLAEKQPSTKLSPPSDEINRQMYPIGRTHGYRKCLAAMKQYVDFMTKKEWPCSWQGMVKGLETTINVNSMKAGEKWWQKKNQLEAGPRNAARQAVRDEFRQEQIALAKADYLNCFSKTTHKTRITFYDWMDSLELISQNQRADMIEKGRLTDDLPMFKKPWRIAIMEGKCEAKPYDAEEWSQKGKVAEVYETKKTEERKRCRCGKAGEAQIGGKDYCMDCYRVWVKEHKKRLAGDIHN